MRFVQHRLTAWGYDKMSVIYTDPNQMIAFNSNDEKAIAIFTPYSKPFEYSLEFDQDAYTSKSELQCRNNEPAVDQGKENSQLDEELVFSTSTEKTKGNNNSSGTGFIKAIITHARKHKFKRVLIVSDDITTHGKKSLSMIKSSIFQIFTYDEVCFDDLTENYTQPIQSRKLNPSERKEYIEKNPRYKTEIQKLSKDENYVKWMGYILDDIIALPNGDYVLVIENLEAKAKDKKKAAKYDAL
jgi:hypothetical protein